jgi:CIC family chloride channel protein
VISNGSGASVGLEAGYTQLASGLASRLGIAFEVRRGDLRTLVGCGAAGAIAAGFGAPLAGAFYAFELIIGTYTIATLAPVVVAALCGNLVSRALIHTQPLVDLGDMQAVTTSHITSLEILPSLALGLICALLGILIMRGVTLVERLVQASGLPRAAGPAFGGLCVGALALVATPQVLSGGHGALHMHFAAEGQGHGAAFLAGLFAAKATATAISIGSGFRGGLFFASLFLGAIAGKLFAALAPDLLPAMAVFGLTPLAYAVIGMSALFATWRFHLRGETIRSPHDVGWIRSLTVGRLMRRDVATVAADTPLPTFLRAHPLGSPSRVVAVDAQGRYAGIVGVPEAHAAARDAEAGAPPVLTDLLHHPDLFLTPEMNAKDAAATFDRSESEALAVVQSAASRQVLGLLTESHTLKRYSEELDRQRRAMAGESP